MSQSIQSDQKKSKHKKPTRDYCLFMDGSKYNRNIACKAHDNAYGINGGGTEKDRQKADWEFFQHMRKHKDPLAIIAYLGVRFYGWLFFNYKKSILWRGQLLKRIFPSFF